MNDKLNQIEVPEMFTEDHLWTGMEFPVLCTEELARQQASVEDRVHKNRGVWWRAAAPLFAQPCFNYQPIDRREAWPSRLRAPAGFTHLAKAGAETNGFFRSIVRSNVHQYSLRGLPAKQRNKVRSGLASLTVRPLVPADLLHQGYQVYVSWHKRVQWGRDKSHREKYNCWIGKVIMQPQRLKLGAFHKDRLVAFMLPYACEGLVSLSYIASRSEDLHLRPNDVLYHALLSIARQTPGIHLAEFGAISRKYSLDKFKLGYGAVHEFPSYTWINPALRPFVIGRLRRQYPWLLGTATQGPRMQN